VRPLVMGAKEQRDRVGLVVTPKYFMYMTFDRSLKRQVPRSKATPVPAGHRKSPHAVFLTHNAPLPLVSGDRIRTFNLARELVRNGWRVSIFSLSSSDISLKERQVLDDLGIKTLWTRFPRESLLRRARLAGDVVARRALHHDFFVDNSAIGVFREWPQAREADVFIAGLYMFRYIDPHDHDRLVLDSHNAEARRVKAMASVDRSLRAMVATLQEGPVRRFEAAAARAARRVIAVSGVEKQYFEELAPGKVDLVPNGVDVSAFVPRAKPARSRTLLFLGSMDYSANVDAVRHLVRHILPLVRTPDVEVVVIGSNPGHAVYSAARHAGSNVRVEVLGFVEDTDPYFQECRGFVVPLRYGGGTRLKILEAIARGVPVLSTSVGAEGLDLVGDKEIMIRDDPLDFATEIDRMISDDELCARLGLAGRKAAQCRYDWDAIGRKFVAAVSRALPTRPGS